LRAAGVMLRDRSDTEVLFELIRRDGVRDAVVRIDGMFAFAFRDGATGALHSRTAQLSAPSSEPAKRWFCPAMRIRGPRKPKDFCTPGKPASISWRGGPARCVAGSR
jgi:Glutamine amidotransferase domain